MDLAGWIAKFGKKKHGKFLVVSVGVIAAIMFILVLPYLMFLLKNLDFYLGFGEFNFGLPGFITGIIFAVIGVSFALWTVFSQLSMGTGTPLPFVPTQKLIVAGPYKYSRNPMVFGGFLYLYGVSIVFGSISSLIFTTLFFLGMLLYIKLVEEKELELRFGQSYLDYEKQTRFLIPFVL